jgi:hypothetical protein
MSPSRGCLPQTKHAWVMPIRPEAYDRSPLSDAERQALAHYMIRGKLVGRTQEREAARRTLTRLAQPLQDVHLLLHPRIRQPSSHFWNLLRMLYREMHRREAAFWQWSREDWIAVLGASDRHFTQAHGTPRRSLCALAYFLCGFDAFERIGGLADLATFADPAFGPDWHRAYQALRDVAVGMGYKEEWAQTRHIRNTIAALLLWNRSPRLEDLSRPFVDSVAACLPAPLAYVVAHRVVAALEHLEILEPQPRTPRQRPCPCPDDIPQEWYAWGQAWYDTSGSALSRRVADHYLGLFVQMGRWLRRNHPDVVSPEQWTEALAVAFRTDLLRWTCGEYAAEVPRRVLAAKGQLGRPAGFEHIDHTLTAARRIFGDLQNAAHAVDGAPPRRLPIAFTPQVVFRTPAVVQQALKAAQPRDIDRAIWRKLMGAAVQLSEEDRSASDRWPLSAVRAMAFLWLTAARRPNELLRLRLDCVRRDWHPGMRAEDDGPLQPGEALVPGEAGQHMCYLCIPSTKYGGGFWIWIPEYTYRAIEDWKRERAELQGPLYDRKDREQVDFLFCQQNRCMSLAYLNERIIPLLCAKANVTNGDAKGRFTGHRGRSTRLSLLLECGLTYEELAAYAGHNNLLTIRRYAQYNPIHLHRKVADADELSYIVEGLYSPAAAVAGQPPVRWFLGYDADGTPQFCSLPAHYTCPHRMDCVRCGLYLGGEKAKLLAASEEVQPISMMVPMTPAERLARAGDMAAADREREQRRAIAPPVPPSVAFLSNPLALTDTRLRELADEATEDALAQLTMVVDAVQRSLEEVEKRADGRNVLVSQVRKRLRFVRELQAQCGANVVCRRARQGVPNDT